MSSETRVIETFFEAGSWKDGVRSPAFLQLRSKSEVDVWAGERRRAAEHEGRNSEIKFFAWDDHVPPGFSGLAVEEIRFMRSEGKRTRIWAMPDGIPPRRDPAPGIPNEILPTRCTRTSYSVRVVKDGKPTALPTRCETPNEAKESASYKCRALGFTEFHELDKSAILRVICLTAFMSFRLKRYQSRRRQCDDGHEAA
jgi:hypothetical protein